jgi:F420-dependent oxidoreductase-like protein
MKIGTMINYAGDFFAMADQVVEMEQAGLDIAWVAEAYSHDAVSQLGYLAARTERIELGAGILNVYSRTPAAVAQTAAGLDLVSNGRFVLGLGASGPQVIEGFHGMRYEKPMPRTREYIDIVRMTLKREKVVYDGKTVQVPLPEGEGTGLGKALKLINHPVRDTVPIYWASLMPLSVRETARMADGWLPVFFMPDRYRDVWGDDLDKGLADRDPALGPLEVATSVSVAIGDEFVGERAAEVHELNRLMTALYWGGMGAKGKNFYNTIAQRYGYEAEAAEIQDLYLDGHKQEAAAKVPADFLDKAHLVGPEGFVQERLSAWKEAGVTTLNVALVGGQQPSEVFPKLRELIDNA